MLSRIRDGDPDVVAQVARGVLEQALRDGDHAGAEAAALLLLERHCTLAVLYSEIVQPVLDAVGHEWATGRAAVADEHMVTATTRVLVMRLLAHRHGGARRDARVVLVPPSGEAHVLGLVVLHHVLVEAGWKVSVLDALGVDELLRFAARAGDVALVGYTLHTRRLAPVVARDVRALRIQLPTVPVMVGGLAVREDPGLPARVGAAGGAGSLDEALVLVDALSNALTPREREVLALVADGLRDCLRTVQVVRVGLLGVGWTTTAAVRVGHF